MNFMNPEKTILENEQIEREEQSINEPLSPEEDEQLTLEKRQEEADQRDEDLSDGWTLGE